MLPDIEVELTFLTSEQGGRRSSVSSGYRPQFFYDDHDWDAIHNYGSRQSVSPGETVIAYLTFLSPEFHLGRIYIDMSFQVREGSRTIANGYVTKILNLPISAQQADDKNPKRYAKYIWTENRGDEYADWGGATYYFECRSSGWVERQLEVYENGVVLMYDANHHTDSYGMLSDKPLDIDNFISSEITAEKFLIVWRNAKPYNRKQE